MIPEISCEKLSYINNIDLSRIPHLSKLSKSFLSEIKTVSKVIPFKTNDYVIKELIDWDNVAEDPIFRIVFPTKEYLTKKQFDTLHNAVMQGSPKEKIDKIVHQIRLELNPHPSGQMTANVPRVFGNSIKGVQHKYPETVLAFPHKGQTCFSYCSFCFRWPQFIGNNELKISLKNTKSYLAYLSTNKHVSDVLITGGDPMTMNGKVFSDFIEPLLDEKFSHIKNIRIGTKVLTFWPQRFLSDPDADIYLKTFEKIYKSGKHMAFMVHINHPQELATPKVRSAIDRILATGAVIRCQSPLLNSINDSPQILSRLWQDEVSLGMIPYYLFVGRDTGPKLFSDLPLARAYQIFSEAYRSVSGLARTVRGPVMSAYPGKVNIVGIEEIGDRKVFLLKFLQARDPELCDRVFLAKYDEKAAWLSDLMPAFKDNPFLFENP